jgi:hypothetical protein
MARMDAARKRDCRRMVMDAQAIWHGTRLDGPSFRDWCAAMLGENTALPENALAAMLAKHSADLKTVSWAEALKERPHGHTQ